MAIVVDPRFRAGGAADQPESGGSILRNIAAKTPGVDYYPPTDQLGSYGQGPLGEPTFEPFDHAYVDWLVKRTQEEDAADQSRPPAATYSRMSPTPQPATRADPGARSADGNFQVAQAESDAWRREIGKYYPHFQTDAPPPPDKTRQQLLDQAARDEAWAKNLNQTADALERGSDALYDLDPDQRDYLDEHGGQLTTEIDGAIVTGGWLGSRQAAKFYSERAKRARAKAATAPK